MSDGLLKKTGQSAADTARKVAKQFAQEPAELLKSASIQVTGQETDNSDIIQKIVTGNGEVKTVSEVEEIKMETRRRKRITELEEEIKKIGLERKKKEEEWAHMQQEEMEKVKTPMTPSQVIIEPTTKPKRGMLGTVKKKQGTQEMQKNPSG